MSGSPYYCCNRRSSQQIDKLHVVSLARTHAHTHTHTRLFSSQSLKAMWKKARCSLCAPQMITFSQSCLPSNSSEKWGPNFTSDVPYGTRRRRRIENFIGTHLRDLTCKLRVASKHASKARHGLIRKACSVNY